MIDKKLFSELIKIKALEFGFSACGIAQVAFLESESPYLSNYLNNSFNGEMKYLANHFEKRLNPKILVENSKSIICLLHNYTPSIVLPSDAYQISCYAYGSDYHVIIKQKLKLLLDFIKSLSGNRNARYFVDSAPVMEKAWAQKAGLGWIGKNGCLINKHGSYFFISEIIIDLELEYDSQTKNHCGTCTRCLDNCPTQAIIKPMIVDARKCLSYLTIEHKSELPEQLKSKFGKWIYGCDICQQICPHNRKSIPTLEPNYQLTKHLSEFKSQDWIQLTESKFKNIFTGSAINRIGYEQFMRNIKFISNINFTK